jgi:GNAT superfamily N-acetyltransferase
LEERKELKIKIKEFPETNLKLVVKEGEKHLWKCFHPYHYMTAHKPVEKSLPSAAKFYTFYWLKDNEEILVGCLGVMFQIASYPAKRLTRVVVLPEYQGLGISSKMINSISDYYTNNGFKVYGATFHPRLGEFRENSKNWEAGHYNKRAFKLSDEHSEKGMSGLRDGEIMYRHFYVQDKKYTLNYDIIKFDNLNKESLELEKDLTDENIEEYNELKKQQRRIAKVMKVTVQSSGVEKQISDEENEKYKKTARRNKRKVLTRDERKALKQKRIEDGRK